ncbi:MAG: CBS domain-containing protein [Myxococcales bacterium]|nr:CBS domain-containing protein [Myxococcales bacterium]
MQRHVHDVLRQKSGEVFSVPPSVTVLEAVEVMTKHHIGAVLVMEAGRLAGVFSERDVLARIVAVGRDPKTTRVSDVMTTKLYTLTANHSVLEALELMTEHRCRHIPVMDGDTLVGLISIGDATKHITEALETEVHNLSSYISSPYLRESVPPEG